MVPSVSDRGLNTVEELPPGVERVLERVAHARGRQRREPREVIFDDAVFGFPVASLSELEVGEYRIQAVLHRYATFERAVGPPVELPASWAANSTAWPPCE